jgi:ABC-type multidrug transport system fused ATPase/permease subunit
VCVCVFVYAQVEDAAILACIHDEVLELEAGYDSPVGASGERVSLMLRQRLVLARAVCRRTPIILMDQPLSTQVGASTGPSQWAQGQ